MTGPTIDIDLSLGLPGFVLRVKALLPGAVTAVMGPSGAGKTSLLEAMAGLRRGARGRLVIGGEALLDDARKVDLAPERRRVGYVPQDAGLFPHLSVLENVRFGARADAEAVNAAIDTPDTEYPAGRLTYTFDKKMMGGTLLCWLPSGRPLAYPAIKCGVQEKPNGEEAFAVSRCVPRRPFTAPRA